MVYKNIEIHNVREIVPCPEGGVTWLRWPKEIDDRMESKGSLLERHGTTGVELRFVMNSPTVTLRIQAISDPVELTTYQIFYGGLQGDWECHELNTYISNDVCDIVIRQPGEWDVLDRMTAASGLDWDPRVVRIIFNRGIYRLVDVIGDVEPPKKEQTPKKALLTYGSSITHGSNALTTPNTYAFEIAHKLNMDIFNLGMAGNCRLELAIVDYIASLGEQGVWDVATLELGVNVLDWEEEKILERVTNTVSQIAGRNPDKQVFVISPYYCGDDFNGGDKAPRWRTCIAKVCGELALENVTYINGLALLGDVSLLSTGRYHPNIFGAEQIAQRLTDRIKSKLSK